jgi:hypothetical protein
MHLKAILTDIFLVDEIFNGARSAPGLTVSS